MESLTNLRSEGLSLTTIGGDSYTAVMRSGRQFPIRQEEWSIKADYYLDTFVYYLEDIIAGLRASGNPLRRVLEIGVARGVLSIGIALITGDQTHLVGIDIEEKSKELVMQNATNNHVTERIEVRIGDLFEPVLPDEKFDLIFGELPLMPIDPEEQRLFLEQGHASEILNISGGADGRYFIDALIRQGSQYLNAGGAILVIHPSFINAQKTLDMMAEVGLSGEVLVSREWLLRDTKFTRRNKPYLEKTHGYTFPINADGEELFYLQIIRGSKPADVVTEA
ncbi:MAG: methyltransferase domain-containing protein [Caldilineaceae bacterium]